MPDTAHDDLLAGFTASQPYTMDTVAGAPLARCALVLDGGAVVYIG
ncbi:hypothetical protein [Micromonospora sp. NPDC005087]